MEINDLNKNLEEQAEVKKLMQEAESSESEAETVSEESSDEKE